MPPRGQHLLSVPRGYWPSSTLRRYVLQRDHYTCQTCGATADQCHIQVAHKRPWPEGPTEEHNLQALCTSCNLRERRPYPHTWKPKGTVFQVPWEEYGTYLEGIANQK